MRIKKIELKNFKRFSDLTISNIPETSKLVLLIGLNGSEKSCLSDAFDWLNKDQHKLKMLQSLILIYWVLIKSKKVSIIQSLIYNRKIWLKPSGSRIKLLTF